MISRYNSMVLRSIFFYCVMVCGSLFVFSVFCLLYYLSLDLRLPCTTWYLLFCLSIILIQTSLIHIYFFSKIGLTAILASLRKLVRTKRAEMICLYNKGNNKITELRTILQRESQNS